MSDAGRTFADRYLLDVQVSSPVSPTVWRALDTVLNRWVTLYLLDETDSRRNNVVTTCLLAAANAGRNSIALLDVIESGSLTDNQSLAQPTRYVGIVTEWAEGTGLDERLTSDQEPFTAGVALDLVRQLAVSLAQAHDKHIGHGRLRPHNVLLNELQPVRISGFGVDCSFLGLDETDPIRADIKGVGNLLFAMVTGVWPAGEADGLPTAPISTSRKLPSALRGAIPHSIDALYLRTQDGSITLMRELIDLISVGTAEASVEQTSTLARLAAHPVTWHGRPETHSHRVRATAIAVVCVLGMGWIGWQLMTHNFNKSEVPASILLTPEATPRLIVSPTATSTQPIQAVSVKDYDPFGDNSENPDLANNAIDADAATAWTTVKYRSSNMAGKPGVGLLLDLGAPRPVSQVNLDFTVAGMSATVFVTDSANPDVTTAQQLGSLTNADMSGVIKSPRAISGRYVLVWITAVPETTPGTYQGGITSITFGL